MKEKMTNEEFYTRCSELLGITHDYKTPPKRRNRWNARNLGNGRFPGFGLIRCYGAEVMITTKTGTRMARSKEEALDIISDSS